MAARNTIAINDGETTPVAHTFTPNGPDKPVNGVLIWRNWNSTIPAATETLTLWVKDTLAKIADFMTFGKKVEPSVTEIRLRQPVMFTDTSTGLVQLDYVNEAILRFNFHPRATEQQRKNLRMLSVNALNVYNYNQVIYAVDRGEQVW